MITEKLPLLFIMDEKNYTDAMPCIERFAVRGIILKDGKYAMQKSKDGIFKIPGGGIESGESRQEALSREVAEETGLVVDVSSIEPFGEIIELRKDIHDASYRYIGHSYVYTCCVTDEIVAAHRTEMEMRQELCLSWATMDDILHTNRAVIKEGWRLRDTRTLEEYVRRKR